MHYNRPTERNRGGRHDYCCKTQDNINAKYLQCLSLKTIDFLSCYDNNAGKFSVDVFFPDTPLLPTSDDREMKSLVWSVGSGCRTESQESEVGVSGRSLSDL